MIVYQPEPERSGYRDVFIVFYLAQKIAAATLANVNSL